MYEANKVEPLMRISRLGMRMDRYPIRNTTGQILVISFKEPYEYIRRAMAEASPQGAIGFNAFRFLEDEVDIRLFGLADKLEIYDPAGYGPPRLIELGVVSDVARKIYNEFSNAVIAILDNLNLYGENHVSFEWQGVTPYAVVFVDKPIYNYAVDPLTGRPYIPR